MFRSRHPGPPETPVAKPAQYGAPVPPGDWCCLRVPYIRGEKSESSCGCEVAVETRAASASSDFEGNPRGYLYRAAINEALNVVRSRERQKLADGDLDAIEVAAAEPDPERADKIGRIRAAMAKMQPKHVEILNLHYVEDYSCRQIAKMLGRPLGTVLSDVFRARAELKRLMRIQEQHREKQEKKHEADPRAILADSSAT